MADYCWPCAQSLGAKKEQNDYFIPLDERGLYAEHARFSALCEGCGWTIVNMDGECQHLGCHGLGQILNNDAREEVLLDQLKDAEFQQTPAHRVRGLAMAWFRAGWDKAKERARDR